ncbi:MAG: tRNA guanosine(34) transglycosylase Tgt [bacterium]|nr:tRNA guanosine(34) transglycosylase Tgt [bacterium]
MFRIEKKMDGALGRAGVLETPHGSIETPAFVTVGTKATVKALTPEQVKETGAQVVLGNTYHLYLEPGEKIVEQGGGLGKFMGWDGPTMTDSGGFQVFSLGAAFGQKTSKVSKGSVIPAKAGIQKEQLDPRPPQADEADTDRGKLVAIDEDGVTFKSYKDGSVHRFTPERSIEIQHAIGADIIFAFDECTSPSADKEYQREAMERTHRWAHRSLERHLQLSTNNSQLFGIVQGGRFEDLRKESARVIGETRHEGGGFDGFGIGGSFEKEDMGDAVRWVNELLPEEKPRHLLGIGDPVDLFDAVENGCDLFDCVAPTRQARTGSLYTKHGRFNIENSKYKTDFTPIEEGCECYTCKTRPDGRAGFTRAYLAHLFRSNEILANTLASIHNVYFMVQLVAKMREGIMKGIFVEYKKKFLADYKK